MHAWTDGNLEKSLTSGVGRIWLNVLEILFSLPMNHGAIRKYIQACVLV